MMCRHMTRQLERSTAVASSCMVHKRVECRWLARSSVQQQQDEVSILCWGSTTVLHSWANCICSAILLPPPVIGGCMGL